MVELTRPEALAVIERVKNETSMMAKLGGGEEGPLGWIVIVHSANFVKQFLYEGWESVEAYVTSGETVGPDCETKGSVGETVGSSGETDEPKTRIVLVENWLF